MSFWTDWSDGKKWLMGIVTALAVCLVGTAANRLWTQPKTTEAGAPPAADCSALKGYPLGQWKLRGVQLRNGPQDIAFNEDFFLDIQHDGTWHEGVGKQKPDGNYSMLLDAPLRVLGTIGPGRKIIITFKHKEHFTSQEEKIVTDLDRRYSEDEVMFISSDGCSMRGYSREQESAGNIGAVVDYCWSQATCIPLPEGEKWRTAVPGTAVRK